MRNFQYGPDHTDYIVLTYIFTYEFPGSFVWWSTIYQAIFFSFSVARKRAVNLYLFMVEDNFLKGGRNMSSRGEQFSNIPVSTDVFRTTRDFYSTEIIRLNRVIYFDATVSKLPNELSNRCVLKCVIIVNNRKYWVITIQIIILIII